MAARLPLIAGNWKMNLNHLEAIGLVQKIAFSLPEKYFAKVEVAVLVPFTALRSVQSLIEGDKMLIRYGAQDLSPKDSGAYTGDVSGAMLAKLDCSYVIVGHSERREYHGEDDALVGSKVRAALRHGLVPILCVGEGLEIREAGGQLAHSTDQLRAALKGLSADQVRIGYNDGKIVVCRNFGGTHVDAFDHAHAAADFDTITDLDGALHKKNEARDEVVDDGLQAKADTDR